MSSLDEYNNEEKEKEKINQLRTKKIKPSVNPF